MILAVIKICVGEHAKMVRTRMTHGVTRVQFMVSSKANCAAIHSNVPHAGTALGPVSHLNHQSNESVNIFRAFKQKKTEKFLLFQFD